MSFARFFGEGPTNALIGPAAAVDLTSKQATAVITIIADAVFAVITFNYPFSTSVDISASTFKAGMELVGVTKYTLTSGTIIAYHSK